MGRRGVAVDAHADAVWVFEPLIGVESLPPESQSYAAEVYAQVTEKMLPEITEAVAKGYDAFQSALRCTLSGALADELHQGWLMQTYVQCVAIVVERVARSVYTFEPEVAFAHAAGRRNSQSFGSVCARRRECSVHSESGAWGKFPL